MDTQPSSAPAAGAVHGGLRSLLRAAGKIDAAAWLAVICILQGWFFIDTLAVTVGPLQHAVRFYDMPALIANPMQLFIGIDRNHALMAIPFGVVCLGALLTPLAPYIWGVRAAWLAYLVPLALIVLCGGIFYARTSGDFLPVSNDTEAITGDLIRLANDLIHRGSEVATRHVSIAGGSYLALVGSVFLAARGIRRFYVRPIAKP